MEIYRGRYRWQMTPDDLELESLMIGLEEKVGIKAPEWYPDTTLGEIIDWAIGQKAPESDCRPKEGLSGPAANPACGELAG